MENYESLDVEGRNVKLCVFREVVSLQDMNAFIFQNQLPICIVDAKIIVGTWQIATAVHYADIAAEHGTMRARNLQMEVILSLSPGARLQPAQKYVVPGANTREVLVIILEGDIPNIPGIQTPQKISEYLKEERDLNPVKEAFHVEESTLKVYSLETVIVNAMTVAVTDLVRTKLGD